MQDKKQMSEADITAKYIKPAIVKAGWNQMSQISEQVTLRLGRINVRGQCAVRETSKAHRAADIVLYLKTGIPIAVIEAKRNTFPVAHGMQQALEYAKLLDVPFAFSSNGDGFVFHDKTHIEQLEKSISLAQFPSPDTLWQKYCAWRGYQPDQEAIITQDYYSDGSGKTPRYYQLVAINRTTAAIANGQQRILLVMATGTGKTYTAFQIIWRLWKARAKKRILFLADRNILVDQAKSKDFAPFKEAMTKIDKRTFDPAYEIFLALYQAITGKEESKKIYKKVSPDFFDLIVIDECHRGSASEDSQWREILDYFASATQIGLTATPKETETTSNSEYFGEPIFTYSLKQGIDDGFLANYKLIDVKLDIDVAGWTPDENQVDKKGQLIEQKHYTKKDFDRKIVIEERTETVAKHISTYLKATDPMMKTIVFCDDTDHASRMREALINCNPEQYSKNDKYIMRITGDDDEGKKQLDQFINPKKEYPVIVTTSDLMTTGVDATTCKLIVLDKTIRSMTTFKQIIGRGTRIDEKYGKLWFTIMDFKGASALFADPDFDGEPVRIKTLTPEDLENETTFIDAIKDEVSEDGDADVPYVNDVPTVDEVNEPRRKYHVDGVAVEVTKERVKYFNEQGQSVTESVRDYSRKNARKQYASLDTFIQKWSAADKKQAIIEELQQSGILFTELQAEFGNDLDPFDLICHVAFDKPPLTRQQRAEQVKQNHDFSQYNDTAKKVLEQLLDKYADAGLQEIQGTEVLKLDPFTQMGRPLEIIKSFGGRAQYLEAVNDLTMELYKVG